MPFSSFLAALFQSLAREGVRFCVLRNYEGFPSANAGNDIDFLILPSELPRAIRALRSIRQVRISGYTELPFVANVFLAGVCPAPGSRALQIDFDLNLTWKGLPYLSAEAVLEAAIPRQAGNLEFFVPSPVHEAIISLFGSLLIGGWLKEKYFPGVQRTFAGDRSGAIAALLPQFGDKAATGLVDAVIDGSRDRILGCIGPLRASLARRSLLRRPVRGALSVARHYARVFAFRHSPQQLETVCVLGSDSCGKTQLIEALAPMLRSSAGVVEKRLLPRRPPCASEASGAHAGADSSAGSSRGPLVSMAKLVFELLKEWRSRFAEKKALTLCIFEGYDLLAGPQRRHDGGPMWFARLAGRLFPSPDLWLLLAADLDAIGDADADGRESKGEEALPPEEFRRPEAGRSFAKAGNRRGLLDASQAAGSVAEEAYAAIIDTLAGRAARQLKRRFRALDAADAAGGNEGRTGGRA